MILPDFVLANRINQCWHYSGMDSPTQCLDKKHFKDYGFPVLYQYNSRGYRDQEWPSSIQELKQAIWCVGDSFTVGVGSPLEHTWPHLLQKNLQQRVINVSLDGASNHWIARKVTRILQEISPKTMIIHWSYINRREMSIESALDLKWKTFYNNVRDPSWPDCVRSEYKTLPEYIRNEIDTVHGGWIDDYVSDECRIMQHAYSTDQDDVDDTLECIRSANKFLDQTKIIHSFIPNFVPNTLKDCITLQIQEPVIPEFSVLDLARDGHHYDRLTSQHFVDQLVPLLK